MGILTSTEIGRIIRMDLVIQTMNTGWVGLMQQVFFSSYKNTLGVM